MVPRDPEILRLLLIRVFGMIVFPTTTMRDNGLPAPDRGTVFREHLAPLLFITAVAFGTLPVLAGSILGFGSSSAKGLMSLISTVALALHCGVMAWIAGKIMPMFARETGAGDIEEKDAYVLAVLAGTPVIIGTIGSIATLELSSILLMVMLCISVRAYWIGGQVITGLSGAHRVRVVGMVFITLFFVGGLSASIFLFIALAIATGLGI